MTRWVYYTFRNLWYYRMPREIDPEHAGNIVRPNFGIDGVKRSFTDAVLAAVGLQTVDDDADTVPWYIPLSRAQKNIIQSVSKFGYKVGLK